jgi:hypothetical protein
MAQVIHTVNVVYGSYSEGGVQVRCDENDDLDTIKEKVKRDLDLNFLPMATFSVKVISTQHLYHDNDY